MSNAKKIILVIGGTGAQGSAVIRQLLAPKAKQISPYTIRLLTRDPTSRKVKEEFDELDDVEVVKGNFMDFDSVLKALQGVYGVFVNTDGFTVGEQSEVFAGMRIFELAKQIGTIKHYVYSNLDYVFKKSGYKPIYNCEHYNGKGRVADWMQQQPSDEHGMVWSVLTSGPYMEMLHGGNFIPRIKEDGTRVFAVPLGKGHIPIVSVDDIGYFARYIFDNRSATSAKDLEIAS
ncbi:unnamed protein product [Didymodactylos carnosus]|uniref:NmrA-like family domain-containing protein 1 n=1 Tax=Didymodactylos carnosus TaxID=1234261 RepID=A0A814PFD4_9BILA|nr:unnamed protein product [Didymodactylos carnosus]CAF1115025.1 unnamed protein product [Didymodactylos carnosus]CAF3868620.1 unnamed protein product [Didymodactylos carnosus]CAF3885004.1 unnamed protein product [Didymodactylos carnosus]